MSYCLCMIIISWLSAAVSECQCRRPSAVTVSDCQCFECKCFGVTVSVSVWLSKSNCQCLSINYLLSVSVSVSESNTFSKYPLCERLSSVCLCVVCHSVYRLALTVLHRSSLFFSQPLQLVHCTEQHKCCQNRIGVLFLWPWKPIAHDER